MLPTPDLSHLTRNDYDQVYEPAEDTFLLLDALEQDANQLQELKPLICLEFGSGSGCVTTFLAQLLRSVCNTIFFCTDINPAACRATAKTGAKNKVSLDVIHTAFASGLSKRLEKKVDVLLFNPPYVVTPSEEVWKYVEENDAGGSKMPIEASWAGGVDGREVIDQMLPIVDALLSPSGLFYIVLIKQNKPEEIQDYMKRRYNFDSVIVANRRAGRENLFIIRFSRSNTETGKIL